MDIDAMLGILADAGIAACLQRMERSDDGFPAGWTAVQTNGTVAKFVGFGLTPTDAVAGLLGAALKGRSA